MCAQTLGFSRVTQGQYQGQFSLIGLLVSQLLYLETYRLTWHKQKCFQDTVHKLKFWERLCKKKCFQLFFEGSQRSYCSDTGWKTVPCTSSRHTVCASTQDNNVEPSVESVSGRNFIGLCYGSVWTEPQPAIRGRAIVPSRRIRSQRNQFHPNNVVNLSN